jgi:GAF domain-containing protein
MSKTETTTPPNSSAKPEGAMPFPAFPAFDPYAAWTASQQAFHKLMADAQAQAQAFADEYAQLEAQLVARAKQAIDTWAQLAQDALAYSSQLSAQARKLGLDAARKFQA